MSEELAKKFEDINNVYYEVFGLSGLEMFMKNRLKKPKLIWVRKFVLFYLLLFIQPIYLISQAYYVIYGASIDINQYILNLSIVMNALAGFVKGIYILIKTDEVETLCLRFENFKSTRAYPERSYKTLSKTANILRKISVIYFISAYLVWLFWMALPFVQSDMFKSWIGVQLTTNNKVHKILPAMYPFSLDKSPNYELVIFYECCMTTSGLTYLVPVDMFLITVCEMYCTQIQVMNDAMKEIKQTKDDKFTMIDLIEEHESLLQIAKQMDKSLSPLLGVQLLTSIISICTIILELSLNHKESNNFEFIVLQLRYYTYFITELAQLLLYCIISNHVKEANENIGEMMYDSPWFKWNKENCVKTQMIILRTQKPILISAMGLVKINLSTFIDVLRVSYSYYTFLRKFNVNNGQ